VTADDDEMGRARDRLVAWNWRRMTMREAIVHFWPEKAARSLSGRFRGARSVEAGSNDAIGRN